MHLTRSALIALLAVPLASLAQDPQPVALTIYNQNFAVARTTIDLDLLSGLNEVTTTNVTSRLEPDSVVLRDPTGKRAVRILEQNYDAAIVSQEWLLEKYEGKTIDFQISTPQGLQTVSGKNHPRGQRPPRIHSCPTVSTTSAFPRSPSSKSTVRCSSSCPAFLSFPPQPTAFSSSPPCAGKFSPIAPNTSRPSSPTSPPASTGTPPTTSSCPTPPTSLATRRPMSSAG